MSSASPPDQLRSKHFLLGVAEIGQNVASHRAPVCHCSKNMNSEKALRSGNQSAMRADDAQAANHFDNIAAKYAAYYQERTASGHSFRARRSKAQMLLGTG